jgi:hypothetical protein
VDIGNDKRLKELIKNNEDIAKDNEEKFKDAWKNYLADNSTYNWERWDKLKQVMFALKKTPDEVLALMDEAEGK